jgi:hypothetical protein
MNKGQKTIGAFIIGSAIIWGAVILGCSLALAGTECYDKIQNILAVGVILHLLIIWGPLIVVFKRSNAASTDQPGK